MRAAHGVMLIFVLSALGLGAVALTTGGGGVPFDPTRPDQGVLAPVRSPPPTPRTVARLEGAAGRVVDVAADGETLAVLTRHRWFLIRNGEVQGSFGDPIAGSPDWLSRPESIALEGDRVYVLDPGRFLLSVWDTAGTRREDFPLRTQETFSLQPVQVVVAGGEPVVVAFHVDPEGSGRWEVIAHGGAGGPRPVMLLPGRGPSFAFHRPYLAVREGRLVGIDAVTLEFLWAGGDPRAVERSPGPQDPPLWLVPRRVRSSYRSMVELRGSGRFPELLELPPFWPSVRDFTLDSGGGMLLAVSAGEEDQHLLYLDPAGRPRWRFSEGGFRDPVFLDAGRAFVAEEGPEETLIRELVHDPA